jgi:hypothetical protein
MPAKKGTPEAKRDMSKPSAAAAERHRILAAAKLFDANEGIILDQQITEALFHFPIGEMVKDIIRDVTCGLRYPTQTDGYDQPIVTDTTMKCLYVDAALDAVLDYSEKYDISPDSMMHKLIHRALEAACRWFDQHLELKSELSTKSVERAQQALKDGLVHGKQPLVKPKRKPQADVNTFDDRGRLTVVHFEGDSVEDIQEQIKNFYKPKSDPNQNRQREFEEQQAVMRKSQEEMVKQILDLQKLRNQTGGPDSPFKEW